MFKKKLKKILSMFMAFAVTAASVCTGAAVSPRSTVPVQAAEMSALVKTYNMVRLDDVLGVKNSSNHNYNAKYDSAYGYLTSCSHGPSDGGNYWSRYPASIYGYYDEVLGTWVQTTVKVWANEAYDLDDGHTCSEWPDKIMKYKEMPDSLSGCRVTTRPCDNQLLRGASFVFSDPDNMTGTVTVYYAEECTIVSALNDSYVLSMGSAWQDTTIQTADGSASQTIYTSRYSTVQFVSSSGQWMTPHWNSDRHIFSYGEQGDDTKKNYVNTQRWILSDAGNGYVYMKNEAYGTYLTVDSNSVGSKLYCKDFNGSNYQKFKIVRSGTQITFHPENNGADTTKVAKYGTSDASTGVTGLTNGTYEFQGWYTGKSGAGEKVYDASGFAVKGTYWSADGTSAKWQSRADSLDLYAYWLPGKLTQTLYFYKDGVIDKGKTKTYQIQYGTTFNVSDHYTLSDSPFANCHYDSISASSWKVTAAGSANVYYKTNELAVSYNGNGAASGSVAGTSAKYGATVTAAQNGFTRTGFSFVSWNTKADGTGTSYLPGATFTAQPATHNEKKILYAIWKDVTAPTVSVSPETASDWVSTVQLKITASDNYALSAGTSYRYCLTTDSSEPDGAWTNYTNGSAFTVGQTLSGTYYLWVEGVSDAAGNTSSSTGYHMFGPYLFDNSAPDISSVKDSYGWYDEGSSAIIDFDITDIHSGIKSITLRDINDVVLADITAGTHQYTFDVSGINFYNIAASDNLGNVSRKMFTVKIGTSPEVTPDNAVWKGLKNITLYALWYPINYTVKFDKNDSDGGPAVYGRMDDQDFTFDIPSKLSPNAYSRDGYVFCGWSTRPEGSAEMFADEQSVVNLTSENGGTVTLYARWKDISAPKVTVTPGRTVNPSVGHDALRSIDVTISISEYGSGLSPDNRYEYGFSTSFTSPPESWEEYCSAAASDAFSVTLPELGSSMTGFYYLWVKQVKDRFGNLSTDDNALGIIDSCHVYGIYAFDNTAPSGSVKYIENNETLGLYNDISINPPYSVMTISDACDDMAGISGFTLVISDADNTENTTSFDFAENGGHYVCRFNLYDCLPDFENIERVNMYIEAADLLGNTAAVPITSYDFGTRQSGIPIRADDIGFTLLGDTAPNHYAHDAFRVEAYIENISHNAHGTSFMGGHKGRLRIYTFGNVHAVSADFGSIKKYINPAYDTHPNLERTVINPTQTAYIFLHDFFVPLGCASSTYTDTIAFGFKKNGIQSRNVIYDVSGTLTDNIKTILKYNAE